MTADERAARIESLLTQHGWVRALARTLVRSDADADDAAQDAWLAALRSPPTTPGAERGWFAAVLRNVVRQDHRGDVRRERREGEAARPEATDPADEIVSRAEEHRRVVDAVLELDEPFRTAILLRFFDGLAPREIAARTGAPVETVRARVRRGLERVRERLDAAHGGGGEAWRAALLPLAGWRMADLAAPIAGGAGASAAPVTGTGVLLMATKATVLTGFVALAAGAAIGWFAAAPSRDAVTATEARAAKAESAEKSARDEVTATAAALRQRDGRIADAESELARVRAEAKATEERAAKLSDDLVAAREELARLRPAAAVPARPRVRFAIEGLDEVLADVDWDSIAVHTTAMVGPMREVTDAIAAGKPVPLKAAGELQKHNGPLVQAVGALRDRLSGSGPNGAYTHPAFQVNALAAALEQIGMPLSDAQRTAMHDLGRRFTDEETRRVALYDERTFQMRKLVEEGALRGRFFEAVRKVLTKEQIDAVSPESIRDRTSADLWSEGLLWATVTRPVAYKEAAQLRDTVSRTMGAMLRLDEAGRAKLAKVVEDWVSHLPPSLTSRESDALERAGMMPSDLVAISAGETLRLVESVVQELGLTGDAVAPAREWTIVFHPIPSAVPGDE